MESIKVFLKLVEIQTKIASIFPFVLGNLFAVYRYDSFSWKHMLIMLISLLCIDMATTTINNYYDYKRAIKKHGYGFESHNAIVRHNMKERTVLMIIFTLLLVGVVSGLYLVYMTDFVVLLIGALSFMVGILYSSGPVPISRTPFGEVFSSVFMGFLITFLAVYIHIFDQSIFSFALSNELLTVSVKWYEIIVIGLLSAPMILGISNIMLANNICDIEDDLANKRYTLPIYVGKKYALLIYKWSYRLIVLTLSLLIILKVINLYSIVFLIILVPIEKMTKEFSQKQEKATTFVNAVKSFTIIGLFMNIMILVNILI